MATPGKTLDGLTAMATTMRSAAVRFVLMRTIFHFLSHFALVLLSTPLLTPPHSSLAHWTLLLPAHNFYLLASCSGTLCSLGAAEQVRQLWAMMTCCFVGCWQRDTQHAASMARCAKDCGKCGYYHVAQSDAYIIDAPT